MGLPIKNTLSADFCADRIDVITNFAVVTNVVIKRVHCSRTASTVSVSIYLSTVIISILAVAGLLRFRLLITHPFIKCNAPSVFNMINTVILNKVSAYYYAYFDFVL